MLKSLNIDEEGARKIDWYYSREVLSDGSEFYYLREAIRIEPEFTVAYFSLADAQIALGQFADAVTTSRTLQSKFGYEFSKKDFADESYSRFVASPQFRKWLTD
jgi:hypothetical protein